MNNGNSHLREFGRCRLDIENKVLWCDEEPVNLPLKAIELLCVLVGKGGEIATKDEIWREVWQDAFVEETNLTHNIYLLRKTLKELGETNLIQTVPRRGYRFAGEVREIEAGEFVIEKHTQTRTLIEIEEEEQRNGGAEERKTLMTRLLSFSSTPLLLFSSSLILLGVFGFFVYQNWNAKTSDGKIKSIAVLPFKVINGNAENEHQGSGLSDVLITRLSNIREITVRPANAVMNFENEDSLQVGRKLKTDAVLEGAIYRVGDKIRVTARLVKVSDGSTVWNGQFEKLLQDELQIQNEIALQITDTLRLNLNADEKNALAKTYTQNADAFEFYQKGRYEWNKRSWAGMLEASRLFRNAIEKDPNFALAYVGLADTLTMSSSKEETHDAIQKALELDPNLAEAYASLGFFQTFHQWKWREAEESFKKSIALNPNYATAHHWYAQVLTVQGRHEEAKTEMRHALEINPLSHNFLADLGQIYYFNHEYEEAENYCKKALEIYPEFAFAHQYLMDIYFQTGRHDEAVEEFISASKAMGTFDNQSAERQKAMEKNFAGTRKIYAEGGIKKFVEQQTISTQDASINYFQSRSFALIGEKEKALEHLENAFAGHGFSTLFLKADPVFDNLRDEPRYREILRKMNLSE